MNWYAGRPTTAANTIVRNTYILITYKIAGVHNCMFSGHAAAHATNERTCALAVGLHVFALNAALFVVHTRALAAVAAGSPRGTTPPL